MIVLGNKRYQPDRFIQPNEPIDVIQAENEQLKHLVCSHNDYSIIFPMYGSYLFFNFSKFELLESFCSFDFRLYLQLNLIDIQQRIRSIQ